MKQFAEKYIYQIILVYGLAMIGSYIDIRVTMQDLITTQRNFNVTWSIHLNEAAIKYQEFVAVKDEQIERKHIINKVKKASEDGSLHIHSN